MDLTPTMIAMVEDFFDDMKDLFLSEDGHEPSGAALLLLAWATICFLVWAISPYQSPAAPAQVAEPQTNGTEPEAAHISRRAYVASVPVSPYPQSTSRFMLVEMAAATEGEDQREEPQEESKPKPESQKEEPKDDVLPKPEPQEEEPQAEPEPEEKLTIRSIANAMNGIQQHCKAKAADTGLVALSHVGRNAHSRLHDILNKRNAVESACKALGKPVPLRQRFTEDIVTDILADAKSQQSHYNQEKKRLPKKLFDEALQRYLQRIRPLVYKQIDQLDDIKYKRKRTAPTKKPAVSKITIACTRCKGTGKLRVMRSSFSGKTIYEACPYCKGTGRITRIIRGD